MGYRWKPSKSKAKEFALLMNEIDEFCAKNGINNSSTNDSYYFRINGKKYRVSNHSVEKSNATAYDELGRKVHAIYHEGGREEDTVYIRASKTRIIQIYNDLKAGYELDGRGNRK